MGNDQSGGLACCSCNDSKTWRGGEDFRPMFRKNRLPGDNEPDEDGRRASKEKRKSRGTGAGKSAKEGDSCQQLELSTLQKLEKLVEWAVAENMLPQNSPIGGFQRPHSSNSTVVGSNSSMNKKQTSTTQESQHEAKRNTSPLNSETNANRVSVKWGGETTSKPLESGRNNASGSPREIKSVLRSGKTPRDGKTPTKASEPSPRGVDVPLNADEQTGERDADSNWTPNRVSVRFLKEAQIVSKHKKATAL
eukprot:CAMPEP_0181338538 /NCGR_PEP_ID=MMETSP1101-20121128/28693_1 /TAXON_ID=46948 /ORGANISM="Rhodomonas abbreviata, Strain Caron Lab Isolate" /LENGTH=249 /DNA_ID=CAMNT_0023449281 /DNA_START=31 /DNA_END=780 /DNA_ORIENTATION=-